MFDSTDDVVGSKMAREMLCFTMETAAVGCEGRICETAVAGYVRAMFALCPRHVRLVPQFHGGLELVQWRAMCGVLVGNATADCWTPYNGGLKVVMGCEWWRRVIGECNCRLLDAL